MNSFIVQSKSLLSALMLASKGMVKSTIVPILENYLFQVTGNRLTISGTDLQTTFKTFVQLDGNFGNFSLVVAPQIVKYLQKLDEQPVIIASTSKVVTNQVRKTVYTEYTVEITADGETVKLAGDEANDFPKAPACDVPLMDVQTDFINEFKDLLNYVSADQLRPAMCGIYFNQQGKKHELCATDGMRVKTVDVSDLLTMHETGNFIIPERVAKIISSLKLKDVLKVYVKRDTVAAIQNVMFAGSVDGIEFELIARTIDERFPDYKNIIPQSTGTTRLTINNKKAFLKLLDKALLFTNKTTKQIEISLNGKNALSASDLDFKNEFTAVIAESVYSGNELTIGFNAELLKEVCANVSDSFTFDFTAPNKCGLIRDGRAVILLMPVMIARVAA